MDFRAEVKKLMEKSLGLSLKPEVFSIPPDPKMGDVSSTLAFDISKKEGKKPGDVASELASKIVIPKNSLIKKVITIGPYINFFIDWVKVSELVIKEVLARKNKYGSFRGKGSVMVEFSTMNSHKPPHIGHVRNMILGESIARLLEASGKRVVRDTYGGDIGPHIAATLWGLTHIDQVGIPKPRDPHEWGKWLGRVYAKVKNLMSENEVLKSEINFMDKQLYLGESPYKELWRESFKWSVNYLKSIYKLFDIKFDEMFWESKTFKQGMKIAYKLLRMGVLKKSEGAIIADLSKYDLGVCVLIRSDGIPLYAAKDLGLAFLKNKSYPSIDHFINVVASEQDLYLKQLFKILEIGRLPLAGKYEHLSYGMVRLPSGKMSTRAGTVVYFDDLESEMFKLAVEEVSKRNKDLGEERKKELALKIMLSALKYGMLKRDPSRDIVFDMKDWLSFEGDTGPYLQYACVRASKILSKIKKKPLKFNPVLLRSEEEINLIKLIAGLPDIIKEAAEKRKPSIIASFAFALASAFSVFYENCPVIQEPDLEKKDARIFLVRAFEQTLRNALYLLGITVPKLM